MSRLYLISLLLLLALWGCQSSNKLVEDASAPLDGAPDAGLDLATEDLAPDLALDLPQPDTIDPKSWAISAGGAVLDKGRAVTSDGKGNLYVTGSFRSTATFGGHSLTAKGTTWSDIFLIKLDSAGKVLWARAAGGGGEDQGRDVAVDGKGNVILVGYFTGPAAFGGKTLAGSGLWDVAIAKYAPDGTLLWATEAGGASSDEPQSVAVDQQGNVIVAGSYQQGASFGQHKLSSAGSNDGFVAKLSPAGQPLWAHSVGGKGADFAHGVAVDGAGDIYIAGSFNWDADFGSTQLSAAGGVYADIYVHKLDAAGGDEWAVSAGGKKFDAADDIVVDAAGNLFITGNFWDVAKFGPLSLTSVAGSDLYVASLNPDGTFRWATPAGGPNGFLAQGIAVDKSGGAYVTGFFQGHAQFGSQGFTSTGQNDIFVAHFSPVGSRVSAITAGGPDDDRAFDIVVDVGGYASVTGWFRGAGHGYGPHTLSSSGADDCFVWKVLCP
jgi:hypothetical protein